MPSPRRLLRAVPRLSLAAALLLAPVAGGAVLAPSASASHAVITTIADDAVLNGDHGDPEPIVAQWPKAGVRNVRMFAQWSHIAPNPHGRKPPKGFHARADGAYPFLDLDRKIDLVEKYGMTVTLVVTGPGPVWGSLEPKRNNGRWRPSPAKFGDFARAVARHTADRVDDYIVWNEPNVSTWLQPQNVCRRGSCRVTSPDAYRKLEEAGYAAIHAADPTGTIAIGATSPKGDVRPTKTNGTTPPLTFLRRLACVDVRYHRITGGDCRGFRVPKGNVLAYHPHSNGFSPGYRSPRAADARMGDLSRLTSVVDRLTRMKRLKVVGAHRFPLWLTEYGYETNPPERKRGVSIGTQSLYSQWGWWIAWNTPRVQMLAQYEWMDEGPVKQRVNPSGWQSGLFFSDGRPKPISLAFANPIFGYRTARAGTIWGQVRTATAPVTVQLERESAGAWVPVKTVTTDARGAFVARVPRTAKTRYRYTYASPVDGTTTSSTTVALRSLSAKR